MKKLIGIGVSLMMAGLFAWPETPAVAQTVAAQQQPAADSPTFTLTTTVNRVLVDVVVTDGKGRPVHGLTKNDFVVEENDQPQTILSFDDYNFDKGMDYVPPSRMPTLQPNTFVDLPTSPERGPLYVLFYDLVNIPQEDQILARAKLIKFISEKPEGARFAIIVSSDDVHLVCGFTSDKEKLLAAVDRKGNAPHVPKLFLMGVNFGRGDNLAAATRLDNIARYLAPFSGRKNVIWFASQFPLALFPDQSAYADVAKRTIDLLATNQISLYPVDTSALPVHDTYDLPGSVGGDIGIDTDAAVRRGGKGTAGSKHAFGGTGASQMSESYIAQDLIAKFTGGRAIYSSNDLSGSLKEATEVGGSYYTLSYAPSGKSLNGHFRRINVQLKHDAGYRLAYRRGYYAVAPKEDDAPNDDSFVAGMEHGAPEIHDLIFGAHAEARSEPGKKVLYTLDYTVMAKQLRSEGVSSPEFEIAMAAFDDDGHLLGSTVNRTAEGTQHGDKPAPAQQAYRMQQQLNAPASARYLRVAVRELRTGKTGEMELSLPLERGDVASAGQ